jgi:hypothetical protein
MEKEHIEQIKGRLDQGSGHQVIILNILHSVCPTRKATFEQRVDRWEGDVWN